jgi:hypothetical protein
MKATLSIRSLTHDASGLRDGYPAFSHSRGTFEFPKLAIIASSG